MSGNTLLASPILSDNPKKMRPQVEVSEEIFG